MIQYNKKCKHYKVNEKYNDRVTCNNYYCCR